MPHDEGASRPSSGTTQRIARVLVVDDEPLVAESVRRVLAEEFDVSSTTDALEALARLTCGDWYDVVLCDVMMPKLNGVQLRDRVHAQYPELAARIILVTGGIVVPSVEQMLERVPNLVLTKPFDFAGLRDFIRSRAAREPAA